MKILIIDNYDSFTYNLYQYVGEILESKNEKYELLVKRNDEVSLDDIKKTNPDKIIISPGPGDPSDPDYFGICAEIITKLGETTPILGVCLGMQGIVYCFGGKIVRSKLPMHGKTSKLKHDGKGVFKGLPTGIEIMRYHSLTVEADSMPDCLEVTASSEDSSEVMAVRHKEYPIVGVQFHPESFASEGGKKMLENFLENN